MSRVSGGGSEIKKSVTCWGVRIFCLGSLGRFGSKLSNSWEMFYPFFSKTSLKFLENKSDRKSAVLEV